MDKEKQIDILAIGDVATEPFIKISDAEAKCDLEGEHCKLCLSFGGKVPYESAEICRAVGNSSNVAVAASRLGLNAYLNSYIGNDTSGKENIEQLHKENVHTDYINAIDGLDSNYHYVLWYGTERTILVRHTEFPYSFSKDIQEPKWIYLSSLASNSANYHREIAEYLISHPNVSLAFQPGTFQIKLGTNSLHDIYANTKIFFSNRLEAEKILQMEENDISKLLKGIYNLGPKIVVITDSINGAYSYDGNEILYMKAFYQDAIESTGAGDAFSGAFMVAVSQGKTISEALMWGAANAMSVVAYVGPHKGLLRKDQLEDYLKNVSEEYIPTKV